MNCLINLHTLFTMSWPEDFLFRPLYILITGFVFLHAHGQPFNIWPEVFLACCVFTTGFFLNVQGQPFNTYLLRLQLKAHCTTKALHCSSKNISRYIMRRRLVPSCNSKRSFVSATSTTCRPRHVNLETLAARPKYIRLWFFNSFARCTLFLLYNFIVMHSKKRAIVHIYKIRWKIRNKKLVNEWIPPQSDNRR